MFATADRHIFAPVSNTDAHVFCQKSIENIIATQRMKCCRRIATHFVFELGSLCVVVLRSCKSLECSIFKRHNGTIRTPHTHTNEIYSSNYFDKIKSTVRQSCTHDALMSHLYCNHRLSSRLAFAFAFMIQLVK